MDAEDPDPASTGRLSPLACPDSKRCSHFRRPRAVNEIAAPPPRPRRARPGYDRGRQSSWRIVSRSRSTKPFVQAWRSFVRVCRRRMHVKRLLPSGPPSVRTRRTGQPARWVGTTISRRKVAAAAALGHHRHPPRERRPDRRLALASAGALASPSQVRPILQAVAPPGRGRRGTPTFFIVDHLRQRVRVCQCAARRGRRYGSADRGGAARGLRQQTRPSRDATIRADLSTSAWPARTVSGF